MPVTIASNPSGSGTFTITNPASASNRTLTLPDAAGTVMLTDTLATQAQLATALNASGSAPLYACRAWVNFNGTGTVAIRASGNVSSVVDGGVGIYTINLTTELLDTSFSYGGMAGNTASPNRFHGITRNATVTTSAMTIYTPNDNANMVDCELVCIQFYR